MVVAFPMYDWPEARHAVDAEWAALRLRLQAAGIAAPVDLARRNADLPPVPGGIPDEHGQPIALDPASLPPEALDLSALWRHPSLLLAQTCWGPMQQGLEGHVTVVGQPDYSAFEGGNGDLYSSALLMRSTDARRRPALPPVATRDGQGETFRRSLDRQMIDALRGKRLAFNAPDSMSGLIALKEDLKALGETLAIFSDLIETGSHRASIMAVADDTADMAAVDCRTWDLAKRFEPAAALLSVVGWTAMRQGLPFITSRTTPVEAVAVLRENLKGPDAPAG